jgi:N-acetyl sugar amidotransferase
MDTSDLEITFDEDGRCNHCTEFLSVRGKYKYQGRESDEKLARVVAEIKRAGKGRPYDCIIGLSGGVDSSYCAHIAKEKGLRVLAVHMDNGWDSEEAVINIKRITSALEIDYESYVLDWDEFKDLQLSFLKASVPEAETPTDVAIVAALNHFAGKYGIKYIIAGGNLVTEGILPKSWHYNAKDLRYFNYISEAFGGKRFRKIPTFGYLKETYYKLIKRVQVVYLLNYVPFLEEEAISTLRDKYGWRYYGGKHYESRYTRFIQSYYLYEKFGIDYRRATLATQVCTDKISRDEASERLKSKPYDPSEIEDEKRYIAKKLGVTADEFERILRLPAKWYWDHPNDDKKLSFVYNTYRKLFKKEKLASF